MHWTGSLRWNTVYEYFPGDVNVISDQLVTVLHGSTLAAFLPHNGKYSYVSDANAPGIALVEAARPQPRSVSAVTVEENRPAQHVAEENTPPPRRSESPAREENAFTPTNTEKSAVTPYALLPSSTRAAFAGSLVAVAIIALLVASYIEGRH